MVTINDAASLAEADEVSITYSPTAVFVERSANQVMILNPNLRLLPLLFEITTETERRRPPKHCLGFSI